MQIHIHIHLHIERYTHECTYFIYLYLDLYLYIYMYIYKYTYMYIYLYKYICMYTYLYTYIHKHVHVHIPIHIHMHVHIPIHIHMHVHTHIHVHIQIHGHVHKSSVKTCLYTLHAHTQITKFQISAHIGRYCFAAVLRHVRRRLRGPEASRQARPRHWDSEGGGGSPRWLPQRAEVSYGKALYRNPILITPRACKGHAKTIWESYDGSIQLPEGFLFHPSCGPVILNIHGSPSGTMKGFCWEYIYIYRVNTTLFCRFCTVCVAQPNGTALSSAAAKKGLTKTQNLGSCWNLDL